MFSTNTFLGLCLSSPQLLRRKSRAFGERAEFGPGYLRMDATTEPAIGACDDVLAADHLGETVSPAGPAGRARYVYTISLPNVGFAKPFLRRDFRRDELDPSSTVLKPKLLELTAPESKDLNALLPPNSGWNLVPQFAAAGADDDVPTIWASTSDGTRQ